MEIRHLSKYDLIKLNTVPLIPSSLNISLECRDNLCQHLFENYKTQNFKISYAKTPNHSQQYSFQKKTR